MNNTTGLYPSVRVDTAPVAAAGSAGGVLLTKTVEVTGLGRFLREALGSWRKPTAVHDPAKVITDLAVTLALGGDCLADAAVIRAEGGLYGSVASEATISRTIATLANDADRVLAQVAAARKQARDQTWALAGGLAPNHAATAADPLIVDLDATLVTSHSEKEHAAPTFKRGFGFHPLCSFVDHGADGTGEALAIQLRPGNAGSNTVTDHIAVTRDALAAVPGINPTRPGRKVLIRTDGAGGTKDFLAWLTRRTVSYSIGWKLPEAMPDLYHQVPEQAWQDAVNADGDMRDGAGLVDLTDILAFHGHLRGWPPRMRVIVRRERPHPGAQLRFEDVDGYRLTAFATNTARGQLADLELRHRRRARCEDRIRISKQTGLMNLPLHGFDQNRIWCALVMLATDLIAWTQLLAFPNEDARRWEPKRLRLRVFSIPAALARHSRRILLHIKDTAPFADLVLAGHQRLVALTRPT
ncbi:IS1380 family transposase [Leekyejoonella antrihumi]|uniref:IS1380 family transposase n=1 Tax=Leekyejoonella antrihumi TaxID=1660198 RepID=A0A563DPQ1_9MICO|nr:IS1380 family transposase [Leekyejoonella antrihumi]TWP31931.1 IS1380 family transposase [Leekyejoonella antrihumi]